ncbi:predicted protein [Naegleria gruberi]|uniref:Predicted protein n=1 Tax=Naegleria gruberi TaxID=5762 RepID=D2VQW0_NAEGR|nr:uncharacterized protein NAEGRDRAFT_71365 [Naegleria gruberi]EFC40780.1 predicted protein [Naegleria gruberi]|eukprot:XP_002673524.1 predicted protein [Naegleria gruberi strain NEG-M]
MKRIVSILLIALTLAVLALSFTTGVSATNEEQASTLSLYIRKSNNKKRNLKRFRLKKRKNNRKLHKYIDTYGRKRRGWKRYGKKRIIRKKIDVYGKKRRLNKKRRIDTYRKKNRKIRRRGGKRNKKVDIYKRK